LIYVDTSALIKLVVAEAESVAVDRYLTDADMVSSALLLVEARRAVLRRAPSRLPQMEDVLIGVGTVDISVAVIESARRLPDPMLRSLDAIHLATALTLRDELDAVLTYDDRLAAAAVSHGLTVESPGVTP
jgi:predicted nucleic acid-binding protein